MEFYDTHAHLDFPDYQADLEAVLDRAREAGITRILSIGTTLESSRRAVALAERHSMVYAVAGWHPGYVEQAPSDIRGDLEAFAIHPKVVALGECGMDNFRLPKGEDGKTAPECADLMRRQRDIFTQHLEVAAAAGLPCVIHQRGPCMDETLEILAPHAAKVKTVFHCFVETPETMAKVFALGGIVSFTGIATFKNAEVVRQSLAAAPIDHFMLETDAPFLAPAPHRGKRCEPAHVALIGKSVAETRGISMEELGAATCATARRLFPKLA